MNENRDREMTGKRNRKEQRLLSRYAHFALVLLLVVFSQDLFAQRDMERPTVIALETSPVASNSVDDRLSGAQWDDRCFSADGNADVFDMWERGVSAEVVYRAAAENGVFSVAEVLGAADVVLELKDRIAKEEAGSNDPKRLAKLRKELKEFDTIHHRILKNTRCGRA